MPIYNAPLLAIDAKETRRYAGLMKAENFDEGKIEAACQDARLLAAPKGIWQLYDYDCETQEIIAEPNGTYQFEPVEFTEPGNYKYTVKLISPEDEKIITEIKEYEINVTVARNDNGDLEGGFTISNQEGSIKYRTISFRNDYKKTAPNGNKDDKSDDDSYNSKKDGDDTDSESKAKKEKSPGTGEPLSPAFGGLALSGILFLIFLIVRKARKGKS